jgi:NAD(P)-dependent dehydrogenase (short-subunit alcohol dehydrogenase family)
MAKKTAIVTGASSGIGLALARAFLARGYAVIGNARSQSSLKKAQDMLSAPDRFVAVEGDIGRPEVGKRLFEVALEQLAPRGVRVNAIAPGVIDTPLIDPAMHDVLKTRSPMNRMGAPEQIVDAALYLVDAEFTTGVVLPVDGGATAGRW